MKLIFKILLLASIVAWLPQLGGILTLWFILPTMLDNISNDLYDEYFYDDYFR